MVLFMSCDNDFILGGMCMNINAVPNQLRVLKKPTVSASFSKWDLTAVWDMVNPKQLLV